MKIGHLHYKEPFRMMAQLCQGNILGGHPSSLRNKLSLIKMSGVHQSKAGHL